MPFIVEPDVPLYLDDGFGDIFIPKEAEWRERGACRNIEDRNIFFSNKQNEIAEAKRLCSICPVQVECRAWCEQGSYLGYDKGVWAGTTHKERQRERRGV
jgi:hypothetical protein